VGQYDGLLKEQLRELCLQRELPVSGTNDELIARLTGWDDAHGQDEPDLLAEADLSPGQDVSPVDPQAPEPPPPPPSPRLPEPSPDESRASQTVLRQRYECPDEVVGTDQHEQWLRETEYAALRAGNTIRGSARRVSYADEGDKRYAIYEVTLGRHQQAAG